MRSVRRWLLMHPYQEKAEIFLCLAWPGHSLTKEKRNGKLRCRFSTDTKEENRKINQWKGKVLWPRLEPRLDRQQPDNDSQRERDGIWSSVGSLCKWTSKTWEKCEKRRNLVVTKAKENRIVTSVWVTGLPSFKFIYIQHTQPYSGYS